jgi:thioredoxin 1
METKVIQKLSVVLILLALIQIPSYAQNTTQDKTQKPATIQQKNAVKYKVTFIELGSVRCIPCQKMQAIMKSIEKKYGNQVKVVFHDVWTPEGKPFAVEYGIESIPTQVFLDKNGKEFSRHVGYFAEEELTKVLNSQGVK